ncbi:hypothetical protein NIES4071_86130 [Calothrix sp. NIES-4071]|nr:hypothetical protein NIES4071_86130 [Calothrix sp. NIES-4071]BAZ62880.1 hypothetical protein NIES4105_86060 [Calothrix sp. NIES-4105]
MSDCDNIVSPAILTTSTFATYIIIKFTMINYYLIKYFRAAISCITASSLVASFAVKSLAQINPDTTLPNNSSVRVEGNRSIIEAGTMQGGNLFHSFREFSVNNGSEAIFNNSVNIQNIITRVTGSTASNINGVMKSNAGANLFLINPSGIIFGANAKLEIGGSFIGSTANAIQFGNLGTFSATNPLVPTPLLTINPSALLFNQIQASSIESNSVASSGTNPSNAFTAKGLRVPDGKSLLLVGGNVSINNGGLYAFGGRVELGGLAGMGTVTLNKDGDNFSLNFPSFVNKSDVSLSNNASVDARAGNGGSIAINARNLEITGKSQVLAGIQNGLGTDNSKAGNIDINATETIFLQDSYIYNLVGKNTKAQGGDINIKTNTLRLEDGGQVGTSTSGAGRSGNVGIDAGIIKVVGVSSDGSGGSAIATQTEPTATGAAGDLIIKTDQLLAQNGGFVSVSTSGTGTGGNLKIDATSLVKLLGVNIINVGRSTPSGLFAQQLTKGATGNAGSLTINTPMLQVLDGAKVSASTFGAGRGGDLKIDAATIRVIGTSSNGFSSGINAQAELTATGAAGNLTIKTDQLLVQNGGQVSASTFSASQGGNLEINATSKVELIGVNTVNRRTPSGLFVVVAAKGATGNAGSLTINSPILQVSDGATVSASTSGTGRGGDLKVDAGKIEVIGTSSSGSSSKINVQSEATATGRAGDLIIKTGQLLVRNGGQVSASTFGAGAGGNLKIDATSRVELFGVNTVISSRPSGLFVAQGTSGATGNAGDLTIKTDQLLVQDRGVIGVLSYGTGAAGNLTISANSINLDKHAQLTADTRSNKTDVTQATININSRDLILRRASSITTDATGPEVIGGNININTLYVLGALEKSQITANSANSRGGNINIKTQGLLRSFDSAITASGANSQLSGNVNITTLIDPSRGLVEIPINLVDPSGQILAACSLRDSQNQNSFIVTGRGGLPINPENSLQDVNTFGSWIRLENSVGSKIEQPTQAQKDKTTNPIIEASAWTVDGRGQVYLVANTKDVQSQYVPSQPNFCPK